MRQVAALVMAAVAVTGCARTVAGPAASASAGDGSATVRRPPAGSDWRRWATTADRFRLREWRAAWMTAFGRARTAGHGRAIAAQGALFDPDRALDEPLPPAGTYRCRSFKVGANGTAVAEFAVYPWSVCRIVDEGAVRRLGWTSGTQRPTGLLFADTRARGVFLGTMVLADEKRPVDYGRDAGRDMIGAVERVAPQRWRLVLPYPRFESIVDVVELVPAG